MAMWNRNLFVGPYACALIPVLIALCGCGASIHSADVTGNSQLTMVATSNGNGQVHLYSMDLKSITLTDEKGEQTPLLSSDTYVDFVPAQNQKEPIVSLSVPYGTYTSATVKVGGEGFICMGNIKQYITMPVFVYGYTPDSLVTVTLPNPIHVDAATTALQLYLDIPASTHWGTGSCFTAFESTSSPVPDGNYMTPTFTVQGITLEDALSWTYLDGTVQSAPSGSSFAMESGVGLPLTIETDAKTQIAGVPAIASLASGMPLEVRGHIQADGSVLATSIGVLETNTTSLSYAIGSLMQVNSAAQPDPAYPEAAVSFDETRGTEIVGGVSSGFTYGSAQFATSAQFANLSALPFTPKFDAQSWAAGQRIYIETYQPTMEDYPVYLPATQVTLLPQTIHGTLLSVGSTGGFTTYEIQLASYDLFPQFADLAMQTPVLTQPSVVMAYADSNTVNSASSLAVGTNLSFHGLVFNDQGALRMDCDQIGNGVPE